MDRKPLDYLANEILSRTKSLRSEWADACAPTYTPQRNAFLLSMPGVLGYVRSKSFIHTVHTCIHTVYTKAVHTYIHSYIQVSFVESSYIRNTYISLLIMAHII